MISGIGILKICHYLLVVCIVLLDLHSQIYIHMLNFVNFDYCKM